MSNNKKKLSKSLLLQSFNKKNNKKKILKKMLKKTQRNKQRNNNKYLRLLYRFKYNK
jgi:hypothetical protein